MYDGLLEFMSACGSSKTIVGSTYALRHLGSGKDMLYFCLIDRDIPAYTKTMS